MLQGYTKPIFEAYLRGYDSVESKKMSELTEKSHELILESHAVSI